ncbi:protein translocase subunit SecDF [Candidatus Solirubrobacter pratensis]|uniref:protein translocase subunit SecDF n=1 Tax=Candidatus Solirubrobacter pratensis TaxID=1298857 RepID=UPI000424CEC4|nr:protein translocase subunit SecDF [Candidatus Solirubrobacter pratensis]
MSERRRSSIVLLLVLALIGGAVAVVATKPTRLGLDLQGGVQLVYHAEPTAAQPKIDADAMQRSIDLMQQRVNAYGVSEAEINQAGSNQIEVGLPGVKDAERAAQQVGSTAQLFFYDWEANLLDDKCKTTPDVNANNRQPTVGLYKAVTAASKCTDVGVGPNGPTDAGDQKYDGGVSQAAAKPRFYAFNKKTHQAYVNGQTFNDRKSALDSLSDAQKTNAEIVEVPAGVLVLRNSKANANAAPPDTWWVLRDRPGLSGADIKNPEQSFDQSVGNEPIVTFNFTSKGRKAFHDITRTVAQRGQDNAFGGDPISTSQHFAIALDNELVSAPYINWRENSDGIDGANGAQISGSFTIQSAQDLAKTLKIGALPLKLTLVSRSQVSATLGKQALDQGLKAGIAGFIIVALFLIIFYRVLGVIATVALGIYALYFYALVKLIPITMTLPGIAGLILTLGVAADANIVVFERVKEEIRAGRGVSTAIVTGYRKGLTAIADANIVTFLVAFILFIIATAGVQGFAFTLGLGVIVSLFTAVLATQAILYSLRGTRLITHKSALGAGEQKYKFRWDYMGKAKWFFSASGIILLIGALAISGKGINFGIDFDGGTRITTALEKPATVEQIRNVLSPLGLSDAKIQTLSNPQLGKNVVQISTKQLGPSGVDRAEARLDSAFGVQGQPEEESIGPSFGKTVAKSALIAIIASLAIISIYIALRFEWKFAVPVLIALMHDVLIVSGVYALVGREVTTSTVAALLTILGYSLYDTIIVFDRVRENIPRMPSAAFSQIVNRSMSEVITRSLATSFCTLLPILSLLLFGGDTLKDFAFALLIGVASGTYSSIFIATPVLTHWKEREPGFRARHERILETLGEVPAYATTAQGGPIDVAPKDSKRGRRRVTTPVGEEVSGSEFTEMVRDLGLDEEKGKPAREPAATGASRPVGGRRARARQSGGAPPAGPSSPQPPDGGSQEPKERKPRNRRHGRPR